MKIHTLPNLHIMQLYKLHFPDSLLWISLLGVQNPVITSSQGSTVHRPKYFIFRLLNILNILLNCAVSVSETKYSCNIRSLYEVQKSFHNLFCSDTDRGGNGNICHKTYLEYLNCLSVWTCVDYYEIWTNNKPSKHASTNTLLSLECFNIGMNSFKIHTCILGRLHLRKKCRFRTAVEQQRKVCPCCFSKKLHLHCQSL